MLRVYTWSVEPLNCHPCISIYRITPSFEYALVYLTPKDMYTLFDRRGYSIPIDQSLQPKVVPEYVPLTSHVYLCVVTGRNNESARWEIIEYRTLDDFQERCIWVIGDWDRAYLFKPHNGLLYPATDITVDGESVCDRKVLHGVRMYRSF